MNALSAQPRCLAAGRVDSTAAAAAGGGVHGVSDDAARSSRQCKYSSKEMGRCCSMLWRNTARREEVAAPASGVGGGLSPVTRARGPRALRTSIALWSRDVWS